MSDCYAVRYSSRGARTVYAVSMLAGAIGALAGIALEQWALLIPSAAVVIVAERVRPYIGEHPQFRLDQSGITLRGFGLVPWRAVASARAFEHATAAGVRAWLMLEIRGEAARAAREAEAWRGLEVRAWRFIGGRGLILRLEGLDDAPDSIRRAFEQRLGRRIAVEQV